MLRLAQTIAVVAAGSRPLADVVEAAVAQLAAPSVIAAPRPADKARALALAWAREQARLALAEALDRSASAGTVRGDIAVDTLAWLVLAGCEAAARESPEAAPDRLHALVAFVAGEDAGSDPAARRSALTPHEPRR
jgi:hypothetical protein